MKNFAIASILLLLIAPIGVIGAVDLPEYTVYQQVGDSMKPTYDECGLVLVKEDVKVSDLEEEEDVIVINHPQQGMVIHRYVQSGKAVDILDMERDDFQYEDTANETFVETKGDNNEFTEAVDSENYIGREYAHFDTPNFIC